MVVSEGLKDVVREESVLGRGVARYVKDVVRAGKGCLQGWQVKKGAWAWVVIAGNESSHGWSVPGMSVVMDGQHWEGL